MLFHKLELLRVYVERNTHVYVCDMCACVCVCVCLQGRVEVEVCLSEQPVGAGPEATLLTVCPLHCIGLSTLSGAVSPDPFCEASVLTSSGW